MYSNSRPPVEVFNFCPRCGSEDFITNGERSKLCNKCNFEYYFNTSTAVAGLIFNDKGELLFTRRAIEPHFGKLDLPGGFVEPMEIAEDALARELKEELGVDVKSMSYYCSFPNEYPFGGICVFTLDLMFKVELETLQGLKAMDDISGFEFHDLHQVNLEELPALSMKNLVNKLIQDE